MPRSYIMTTERTFYSKGGVRITSVRAIFDSKTYVMANITSVATGETPANRTPGMTIAIIGFIMLVVCASLHITGVAIAGGVMLGLGILGAVIAKPTYHVKITSASGEAEPISSKDKEYIDSIVSALNEAIISRG